MAILTFVAPDGDEWQVWNVKPSLSGRGTHVDLSPSLESGWLCFQSESERRRLVPVPEGWYELPEGELIRLWEQASPVSRPGNPLSP
ncbi:hypothetical protein BH20GEM3_BH20GEM3_12870 [soil metagenome]